MSTSGTGFVVCAVCGLTPSGCEHRLRVPVVGGDERHAAGALDRLDDLAEARVGRLDGLTTAGIDARVADHVRVREVHDAERVALADLLARSARATSRADISGLWS